ncbi:MAG: DJ-1/PfpI family protein [Thermoanaerobaculia bacterium]
MIRCSTRPVLPVLGAVLALALDACAAAGLPAADDETAAVAPGAHPYRIAFLVVDGVYGTELTAPYDVLEHAGEATRREVEVFTVSPDGGEIVTAEGLRLTPTYGFDDAPKADVLVVPSAEGSRGALLADHELVQWVATTGAASEHVLSLCWGAFVLAEAGLLDGHAATTFPADYARFAEAFPEVDVRVNVSFVHDREIITSEGGAKSYEAALYLAEHLFGSDVARRVGEGLLVAWPPEGAQFVTTPASASWE